MTRVAGYDPAQVVLLGVQLYTGTAGGSATPVVFNIDSFYLSPRPAVDGATDGG